MVKRDQAKRQDAPSAEPVPMPAADRPQYRAYKPVKMTDGLLTWIDHRFDMTQPFTPDDLEAWRRDTNSPQARILEMQKRLATLGNSTNPVIQMHVAAIRAIHDRLSIPLKAAGKVSKEGWYSLREADHLWHSIVVLRDVMPLAREGKTFLDQRKGRRPGKATVYLREMKQQGETAKELRKRIKEQPEPGAPVYINERDVMIDKSTGKEISIKSLEERLNLRKSQ